MPFVSVPEAVEELCAGRILIVVDDEDRENEGDLTVAAEKITPEIINFMATYGRGLICLALTPERCDFLRLPPMSAHNTSTFGTAFTEAIDARDGVTTGISAADRTRTILTAIDPSCRPSDLARARRRRAGARRPDRGVRGSGAHGGAGARRRNLRGDE
jgi:3,4-dihydroxy 2-butanone 4-phosphate synthase/GTP cyclohydrolase II